MESKFTLQRILIATTSEPATGRPGGTEVWLLTANGQVFVLSNKEVGSLVSDVVDVSERAIRNDDLRRGKK